MRVVCRTSTFPRPARVLRDYPGVAAITQGSKCHGYEDVFTDSERVLVLTRHDDPCLSPDQRPHCSCWLQGSRPSLDCLHCWYETLPLREFSLPISKTLRCAEVLFQPETDQLPDENKFITVGGKCFRWRKCCSRNVVPSPQAGSFSLLAPTASGVRKYFPARNLRAHRRSFPHCWSKTLARLTLGETCAAISTGTGAPYSSGCHPRTFLTI